MLTTTVGPRMVWRGNEDGSLKDNGTGWLLLTDVALPAPAAERAVAWALKAVFAPRYRAMKPGPMRDAAARILDRLRRREYQQAVLDEGAAFQSTMRTRPERIFVDLGATSGGS